MNYFQANISALARFYEFTGRSPRSEFWYYLTTLAILALSYFLYFENAIFGLFICFMCLPVVALTVRRLHDVGFPKFWLWLSFAPHLFVIGFSFINLLNYSVDFEGFAVVYVVSYGVAAITTLILLFLLGKKGKSGPNRYGNDPLKHNIFS